MEGPGEYMTIEGCVSSIPFQNEENGYTVLRLQTEDGIVTAVGCLPEVSPGEVLSLTGKWGTHQSYGEQFTVEMFERQKPTGAQAIYKYLASGIIKGIGPSKAHEIVDKFGDDALRIIEQEPEKLAAVRGISEKRAREIGEWYVRHMGLRLLIEYLTPHNIRPVVAMNLYKVYGDEALDAVRQNPYIICVESYGARFSEVDAMAIRLGFEADCPERVEAAIIFELTHNLNNGHVFLTYEKLCNATHELISVGHDAIDEALEALCDSCIVVREAIAGVDGCYLAELHEAETLVANVLLNMAASEPEEPRDLSKYIDRAQKEQGIRYADAQIEAVRVAASCRVMALTGGPGTGKTTAVRGILAVFDMMGLTTMLCAPTGRAAKRMSELSGRSAATIHRMLGVGAGDGDTITFEHDENNPLKANAVIVDEASMIDIVLMRSLLAALPPGCRLVIVGDADQLPSVGPGNVFSDILRSGCIGTVRLTEIFRQAGESHIVRNAHKINAGIVPDFTDKSGDFFFMRRTSADRIASTVAELCATRLPKNMGIEPSQIQVLSPTRKGEAGTMQLNTILQAALNPESDKKREKKHGSFIFREGDKVMQIRNNYDIMWKSADGLTAGSAVYNGDVGTITAIDFHAETLTVDFDDKIVDYGFEQLSELEPAYAMTVHKSQGSEYHAVVLAMPNSARSLLVRSVLYTAVTRAKSLLVIVGDDEVIRTMVTNDKRQRRYSGLRARLADRS